MLEKTNIEGIRNIAIFLLNQDLIPVPEIPFFVTHPIFETTTLYYNGEWLDLTKDDELEKAKQLYVDKFNKSNKIMDFYIHIRKPYKLSFVKYCEQYMDMKDLCDYLADAWVIAENPNQDKNCSISEAVKLFKKCDKQLLMVAEDYEVYSNLPPSFVVYRGVGVKRNPNGLSWTRNMETAKWFAERWDTDTEKGYIQSAIVSKKDVLAYFNTRNEDEIICKVPKKNIHKIEVN